MVTGLFKELTWYTMGAIGKQHNDGTQGNLLWGQEFDGTQYGSRPVAVFSLSLVGISL